MSKKPLMVLEVEPASPNLPSKLGETPANRWTTFSHAFFAKSILRRQGRRSREYQNIVVYRIVMQFHAWDVTKGDARRSIASEDQKCSLNRCLCTSGISITLSMTISDDLTSRAKRIGLNTLPYNNSSWLRQVLSVRWPWIRQKVPYENGFHFHVVISNSKYTFSSPWCASESIGWLFWIHMLPQWTPGLNSNFREKFCDRSIWTLSTCILNAADKNVLIVKFHHTRTVFKWVQILETMVSQSGQESKTTNLAMCVLFEPLLGARWI